MHYVYIWYKPDGTPFYVGIGCTALRWNPARSWGTRNAFCKATIKKYGTENILFSVFGVASVFSARRYERTLIARLGRADTRSGTLTNLTDGGEGTFNLSEVSKKVLRDKWDANPERKKRLSDQSKAEANVLRAKLRAADPKDSFAKNGREQCCKINADPVLTEKRKNALRSAREKISAGVIASAEKRAATMRTPEVQAKMKKPKTEEHKRKVSEAKKLWWAKKRAEKSVT